MKFAYKKLPAVPSEAFPNRKSVLSPIIPITIEYRSKKIGYEALVDSGADWNIFPSLLGDILGIDVPKGKKDNFGGIGGGSFVAYFHEVTLHIGGWPMKVNCGFSPDIPQSAFGVLGRYGFFDHFMVKFETSKEELEIKEIR